MIIITGVSGGIGNYLFNHYFEKGEALMGTYHLNKPQGKIFSDTLQLDVTNVEEIQGFVKQISEKLNKITLINCAGITYNSFAHTADLVSWKKVIDVNLNGTFYMMNALLPFMRKQEFGRIINLSSIVGQMGVMGTSAYAASKAGINGMIKSIALENAQKNVTVNNINLGYFKVGMIQEVPEELQEKIKLKIGMKEFGSPEHILNTIEYMRSTDYLTGACLDLNGGLV
ncbi:MAG TPA: SDR family NAD(P)-dependent oxidoreductase [Bacteroidia bacterium]|nr:SDR family NAD(P)-dependent oxidoreductase [Bacteroidia bacterium]HRG52711.1 SDR family NAD(P)-dependent oxidoreductase [Bacteroidia bacterium]